MTKSSQIWSGLLRNYQFNSQGNLLNHHAELPSAEPMTRARRTYTQPQLTLLGDVRTLTESGSMVAMEDFIQNNMCFWPNRTGNMC